MLLRRISKHVTEQNWFAVFLDFLIVVVGVFIGIQVANWNTNNLSQAKEQKVLTQLHEEFIDTLENLEISYANNNQHVDATKEVLRLIQTASEPEDQAMVKATLLSASSYSPAPLQPTTLTELIASGSLSDISSPSLRSTLVRFHETMIAHRRMDDLILQRISTPHDGFHAAVVINPDAQADDDFIMSYDWSKIAATREQFQVLYYGKVSLSLNMKQMLVDTKSVLKEIKAVLKL